MAQAKQDSTLTEDYSCGYCLQRWAYMTDPRELPCSHVFCLPCIQGQVGAWQGQRCGLCQAAYEMENLEELPKATLVESLTAAPEIEYCDACQEAPEKAVAFCVDCEKKLCHQHLNTHDEVMGTFANYQHETVSIEIYRSQPNLYTSVRCPTHSKARLQLACSICRKQFCVECDINRQTCQRSSNGTSKSSTSNLDLFPRVVDYPDTEATDGVENLHAVCSLPSLAHELKSLLKDKLKSLSDKITEFGKNEKAAWNLLGEVEEDVEDMREAVVKVTEEKIAAIQMESDQLVAQIQDYLHQSTNTVELYVAGLAAKKEQMESLWKSTRRTITGCHDSKLVQNYMDVKNKIDKAKREDMCSTEVESFSIDSEAVNFYSPVPSSISREGKLLNYMVASIPNHMELVGKVEQEGTTFYSINISRSGTLLCGTTRGAQIRGFDTLKTKVIGPPKSCHDILQASDDLLVVHRYVKRNSVEVCVAAPNSLETERRIFTAAASSEGRQSHISQCGTEIYMIYYDQKLRIHSLISEHETVEYPLHGGIARPRSICVLPDRTILITDDFAALTRYRLVKGRGLDKVWALPSARGQSITYDPQSNLIYGSSSTGIFLASCEGVLLRRLAWNKSVNIKTVNSIAVADGHVILTCRDQGVKKFKLMY